MANYLFLSVWQVEAPIERVWDELSRVDRYPDWWTYVVQIEQLNSGNDHGRIKQSVSAYIHDNGLRSGARHGRTLDASPVVVRSHLQVVSHSIVAA
ncbi:hypothetical protein Tter_1159 [Thermobaculum terrenum ATCC BAA-798]|uniref:Coenzyme Q-binding protein COQ10 START domain-containing protein n=1 Tax=Thermobaculum terrenum (strain ATCC BAA-798 / CCMEE 7001 / YNP1) TaxID=525904 RepID=D1CBA2_THET1|nr:SRPBCC family protein [Thermobaculum terrenum]ACZ42067.1 hypothetical protein Tter_1159 [Thermobaculum terrenum ATCC BAA-798]